IRKETKEAMDTLLLQASTALECMPLPPTAVSRVLPLPAERLLIELKDKSAMLIRKETKEAMDTLLLQASTALRINASSFRVIIGYSKDPVMLTGSRRVCFDDSGESARDKHCQRERPEKVHSDQPGPSGFGLSVSNVMQC
ncbi:MAG: hypothetical protein QF535_20805, partial [Anaerolineales bacterium]|nr:hypothetical protein [Anaerolineales bacterium]